MQLLSHLPGEVHVQPAKYIRVHLFPQGRGGGDVDILLESNVPLCNTHPPQT